MPRKTSVRHRRKMCHNGKGGCSVVVKHCSASLSEDFTEKSGIFINGVLDNIVSQLKKDNNLIKVVMFSDSKK